MSSLSYYYIVRRIGAPKSEYYPTCQVVAFNSDKKALLAQLEVIQEKVEVPYGTTYTIERHPANMSGRDLEQKYALDQKLAEAKNAREAEEAYQQKRNRMQQERGGRQDQFHRHSRRTGTHAAGRSPLETNATIVK